MPSGYVESDGSEDSHYDMQNTLARKLRSSSRSPAPSSRRGSSKNQVGGASRKARRPRVDTTDLHCRVCTMGDYYKTSGGLVFCHSCYRKNRRREEQMIGSNCLSESRAAMMQRTPDERAQSLAQWEPGSGVSLAQLKMLLQPEIEEI